MSPPYDDGGDEDGAGKDGSELVVSSGDAPPVLEPAEHPLDEIALLVGLRVEGLDVFARGVVGDDGRRAAFDQELAQLVGVVSGVGQAEARAGQGLQERLGKGGVTALSGGYFEGDEASLAIDDGVDLGRASAARTADRLNFGPPFPPPAERWAFALVESIMWTSSGLNATKAVNSRRQTPLIVQRRKRL